ncbi:MAG: hypothetical protein LC108_05220 [Anaerolineales bacterium]|nr:hypothetical protein [Anaerolineales bacterium]
MSDQLRQNIYSNFKSMTDEELIEIWIKNDRVEWSDIAFEVLEEILEKRIEKLPSQNDPIIKYQDKAAENKQLEDWEIKLLDDENQPELYDTLEVLSLKDNINKLAKAVVIIYIISALLNSYTAGVIVRSTSNI